MLHRRCHVTRFMIRSVLQERVNKQPASASESTTHPFSDRREPTQEEKAVPHASPPNEFFGCFCANGSYGCGARARRERAIASLFPSGQMPISRLSPQESAATFCPKSSSEKRILCGDKIASVTSGSDRGSRKAPETPPQLRPLPPLIPTPHPRTHRPMSTGNFLSLPRQTAKNTVLFKTPPPTYSRPRDTASSAPSSANRPRPPPTRRANGSRS